MDSARPISTSNAAGAAAPAPARAAVPASAEARPVPRPARPATPAAQPLTAELKPVGYGLPCSNCRAYYPANLTVCPICRGKERVSPTVTAVRAVQPAAKAQPEGVRDEERERFLRELKAKLYAAHTQINHSAQQQRCSLGEGDEHGPATVCKDCHDRLQERVDLMEAALHMDLKEATQIIYDAVWADTSDSSKTYQNAAQALITELRKRAGIDLVLGTLQRLPH